MSFGDALRNAAKGGNDFDPPNGTYTTKIVDTAAYSGADGREWCKVVHEIISGPGAGKADFVGQRFEHFGPAGNHNEVGFQIMAQALVLYGVDVDGVDDLDDLGRAMFEVIGNTVDLSIGHKNGYLQVRVQGSRTGTSDVPTDTTDLDEPPAQRSFSAAIAGRNDEQAAAAGEDNIPF